MSISPTNATPTTPTAATQKTRAHCTNNPQRFTRMNVDRRIQNTSLFNQNSLKIHQNALIEGLNFQNRTIHLMELPNPDGAHCAVYEIAQGQKALLEGVNNTDLVVKVFRRDALLENRIKDNSHLLVLEQHRELNSLGIPVAKLYNEQQVRQNCGYFLFERVHYPFQGWSCNQKISEMNPANLRSLYAIRNYFQQTHQAILKGWMTTIPDLRPDNVRFDDSQSLKVVDFRERALDRSDCYAELEQAARLFSGGMSSKSNEIYAFLFQGFTPDLIFSSEQAYKNRNQQSGATALQTPPIVSN